MLRSSSPIRRQVEEVKTGLLPIIMSDFTETAAEERVLAAASQNAEILKTLENTEEAPGAHRIITFKIKDVRKQIGEQEKILMSLTEMSKEELKQYSKYRDSKVRRFYYRITRMSEALEAKRKEGEAAYHGGLKKCFEAESRRAELQVQLEEAEKEEATLVVEASKHGEAHKRLEDLYKDLFDGPTPGFSEEDRKENSFKKADSEYEAIKKKVAKLVKAVDLLNTSRKELVRANESIVEAYEYLRYTVFGLSGTNYELMDQSRYQSRRGVNLLAQVDDIYPLGDALKRVQQLDRSYTGNAEYYGLRDWYEALVEMKSIIENQAEQLKAKQDALREETKVKARSLEDARQALEQERKAIFERVAGFGQAAPAYNECCVRTRDIDTEAPPAELINLEEPPSFEEAVKRVDTLHAERADERNGPSAHNDSSSMVAGSHADGSDHPPQYEAPKYPPPPPGDLHSSRSQQSSHT